MIKSEYNRWLSTVTNDPTLLSELRSMASSPSTIEDAFYRTLTFGTGGLRGIIGAGTNRMNRYVVAQASQAISNFLSTATLPKLPSPHSTDGNCGDNNSELSVVIGYDSRLKSDEFARVAASVFAANNIRVYLWPTLTPVPTVSYAVRALRASCGIMITASHNPAKYNGYKVYGADGCQITQEVASAIQEQIAKTDIFADVKTVDFEKAVEAGTIHYIDSSVLDSFLAEVKRQSVLFSDECSRKLSPELCNDVNFCSFR